MGSVDKLVARLANNPRNVRFDELVRVLESLGWHQRSGSGGSHRRFDAPDGAGFVVVVEPHGARRYVSPRAVADVLALWAQASSQRQDARGDGAEDASDGPDPAD